MSRERSPPRSPSEVRSRPEPQRWKGDALMVLELIRPAGAPAGRNTMSNDLATQLAGEVISPAHPEYEAARRVWNRAVDRHPRLIVRAADALDVARAVRYARAHDLPLAVRSGGHSMAGQSTVDDGLVIDVSRLKGMTV